MYLFNMTAFLFQFQFSLTLAHDGSGKGAALVAAVEKRMTDEQTEVSKTNNMNNNTRETMNTDIEIKKTNSDEEMRPYFDTTVR